MPLLRKLQHELLLVHHARVARRVLLWDQKRCHNVLAALVLAQEQAACLTILQRVDSRDREELWKTVARKLDRTQVTELYVFRTPGNDA